MHTSRNEAGELSANKVGNILSYLKCGVVERIQFVVSVKKKKKKMREKILHFFYIPSHWCMYLSITIWHVRKIT